jgi:hypothetical protein
MHTQSSDEKGASDMGNAGQSCVESVLIAKQFDAGTNHVNQSTHDSFLTSCLKGAGFCGHGHCPPGT